MELHSYILLGKLHSQSKNVPVEFQFRVATLSRVVVRHGQGAEDAEI
jgi:hypothetical protein